MKTSFGVDYSMKKFFIDDSRIHDRLEKSRLRALRRFGSIVKRHAAKSIKSGRRRSKGRPWTLRNISGPPLNWAKKGAPGLKSIVFGLDGETLVVGPIGFGTDGGLTVPEKLEYGLGGYRQRPFMNPALEDKKDQLIVSLKKFGI
jgi:hypothetical protein